jgi:hypothetical protein
MLLKRTVIKIFLAVRFNSIGIPEDENGAETHRNKLK